MPGLAKLAENKIPVHRILFQLLLFLKNQKTQKALLQMIEQKTPKISSLKILE